MQLNRNFLRLKNSYLFSAVAERTAAYRKAHPERRLIRLSIGDVTRPLAPAVVAAMKRAADEMGRSETFRGYAPSGTRMGYPSLLGTIVESYARKGVALGEEDVFISDGAKSDCGNLSDLFSADNTVLIPDPVYPAYLDTNVMAGRRIVFADGTEENGFLPMPKRDVRADLIYLCSPNNPTGAAYTREELKVWVDYALENDAVILYDAAYEFFIGEEAFARSIYQVEGAKQCAIELCSYSKTAGFTGVRCGYTVVPRELVREGVSLNRLWERRQAAKFNGVSYVTQMGAAAVFTEEGERQIGEAIAYYRENAALISDVLARLGIPFTGGKNSPYIWMKCPQGMDSWTFFDYLLNNANVVGTPGSGFGRNGEGYFRLTAFGTHEDTAEAMQRIAKLLEA